MYDSCIHSSQHSVLTHDVEYNTIIYCVGYSLSIIVLTIAVIIFVTFKWVWFYIFDAELKKKFPYSREQKAMRTRNPYLR